MIYNSKLPSYTCGTLHSIKTEVHYTNIYYKLKKKIKHCIKIYPCTKYLKNAFSSGSESQKTEISIHYNLKINCLVFSTLNPDFLIYFFLEKHNIVFYNYVS